MSAVQVNISNAIVDLNTRQQYAFSEYPSSEETKAAFWSTSKTNYYRTHYQAGAAYCDAYGSKSYQADSNGAITQIINVIDGNWVIYGSKQGDIINGGPGNDVINGGPLTYLAGARGADIIEGGAGNDIINVDGTSSYVHGGSGNDTIANAAKWGNVHIGFAAGDGADTVIGCSNDTIFRFYTGITGIGVGDNSFTMYCGADSITLNNSRDTLINVADANDNVFAYAFMANTAMTIDGSGLSQYEVIVGSNNQNDMILAGSGGSSLWGGVGGNDTIKGGNGADVFFFGPGDGNDIIQNSNSLDEVIFYSPMEFSSIGMSGSDLKIQSGSNSLTVQNWSESGMNKFNLWDGSKYQLHKSGNTISCQRIG